MTEASAPTPFTRISHGLAAEMTTSLNPVPTWQGSATFKNKPVLNSKPGSQCFHTFSHASSGHQPSYANVLTVDVAPGLQPSQKRYYIRPLGRRKYFL